MHKAIFHAPCTQALQMLDKFEQTPLSEFHEEMLLDTIAVLKRLRLEFCWNNKLKIRKIVNSGNMSFHREIPDICSSEISSKTIYILKIFLGSDFFCCLEPFPSKFLLG